MQMSGKIIFKPMDDKTKTDGKILSSFAEYGAAM